MPGRAASGRHQRLGRLALAIAAACFAIAGLLSMLAPSGIDLGQTLLMVDPAVLLALQRHAPAVLWVGLIGPFLVRPVWLLPGMLGLIAAMVAWSIRRG